MLMCRRSHGLLHFESCVRKCVHQCFTGSECRLFLFLQTGSGTFRSDLRSLLYNNRSRRCFTNASLSPCPFVLSISAVIQQYTLPIGLQLVFHPRCSFAPLLNHARVRGALGSLNRGWLNSPSRVRHSAFFAKTGYSKDYHLFAT